MHAYQIQAGPSSQIFHHNPQLVSTEKAGLVLGDMSTGAGAEHGYFLLNFMDIIVTRLEIDLCATQ